MLIIKRQTKRQITKVEYLISLQQNGFFSLLFTSTPKGLLIIYNGFCLEHVVFALPITYWGSMPNADTVIMDRAIANYSYI